MFTAKWRTYRSLLQTLLINAAAQPTKLVKPPFTLLPIIFLLFETIIMKTNRGGANTPLMTAAAFADLFLDLFAVSQKKRYGDIVVPKIAKRVKRYS